MTGVGCVAGGMHGRGGMHGMGRHAWQGACMVGVCMVGGCVWQGVCMVGSMCGGGYVWWGHVWQRGHAWQGWGSLHARRACMAEGVHSRGTCVAGETATAVDGTHPTGLHSCANI